MAVANDRISARERALLYSRSSKTYGQFWVSSVKRAVSAAQPEDWGTYLVACALLETVISEDERNAAENELEFAKRQEKTRKRREDRLRLARYSGSFAGVLTTIALYVAAFASSDSLLAQALTINAAFSLYGSFLFSLIGAFSLGRLFGSATKGKSDLYAGPVCGITALASVAGGFVCSALPPVALVLAWAAWRQEGGANIPEGLQIPVQALENRRLHGRRVHAHDPLAPYFVKRAIRRAGVLQDMPGDAGRVAKNALEQDQSDYGAFVVYDALLRGYQDSQQHEIFAHELEREQKRVEQQSREPASGQNRTTGQDMLDVLFAIAELFRVQKPDREENDLISNGAVQNVDLSETASTLSDQENRGRLTTLGMTISLLVSFVICSAAAIPFDNRATGIMFLLILLVISFVVGGQSAARMSLSCRANTFDGRAKAMLRASWFAAWTTVFGILALYIAITIF